MQGVAITFEPKDFLHIKEVERALGIWKEGRGWVPGDGQPELRAKQSLAESAV